MTSIYICGMEMTFSLDAIEEVARAITTRLGGKKVVALHGRMGAGKTTFIRAICGIMGVDDPVSSPTFSIINEYEGRGGRIFHLDLYRLKDSNEAIHAGVEDSLYSGDLCMVEWPERALSLFPEDTVHIYIEVVDESRRRIRIGDN